jgi:hypothetical protein
VKGDRFPVVRHTTVVHMAFIRNKQVRRVVAFFALGIIITGIVLTTLEITNIGITVLFIGICVTGFLHFDTSVQRGAASAYPIQSAVPAMSPAMPPPTDSPKQTQESV